MSVLSTRLCRLAYRLKGNTNIQWNQKSSSSHTKEVVFAEQFVVFVIGMPYILYKIIPHLLYVYNSSKSRYRFVLFFPHVTRLSRIIHTQKLPTKWVSARPIVDTTASTPYIIKISLWYIYINGTISKTHDIPINITSNLYIYISFVLIRKTEFLNTIH